MSIVSADLLNATVKKISASHGAEGDYESESLGSSFDCRFREISLVTDNPQAQQENADAMIWVDVSAEIDNNDFVQVTYTKNGSTVVERFRVTNVVQARGATEDVVFTKATLERYKGA